MIKTIYVSAFDGLKLFCSHAKDTGGATGEASRFLAMSPMNSVANQLYIQSFRSCNKIPWALLVTTPSRK